MKVAADFVKALSPSIMGRAIMTFDRVTLWVVCACWSATVFLMVCALYTINLSIAAQHLAEAALATEPALPTIQKSGVDGKDLQAMIERLKEHYPDVVFGWQDSILSVVGRDGGHYHEWLTAIGQIDTLNPQFHWNIRSLCIGNACGTQGLMVVNLVGDRIAFQMPQPSDKN